MQPKVFFRKYRIVFAGFFIIQILFDQIRTLTFYITGSRGYVNWPVSILNSLINYALWAIALTFLYKFYLKIAPIAGRKKWARIIGLVCIAGLIQALVRQFFYLTMYNLLIGNDRPYSTVLSESLPLFLPSAFNAMLVALLLITLIAALDYYEQFRGERMKSIELEAQLSNSKLELIQAQLNPHFLFNALNTISMMVRGKKETKAVSMISSLSDLLRTSLQMKRAQMIRLEEELAVVTKYLEIEKQRFNDRLSVIIDVEQGIENFGVPNMILQPVLENAFKYGVSENLDSAEIRISAKTSKERLLICVENNGAPLPEDWNMADHKGIGLNNVEKRLSSLFEDYSFELRNDLPKQVVVATIEIPITHIETHAD